MQFQFSPYMLPLFGAALISGWVAAYVWQHRTARGAFALSMMALAIVVWSLGYALEIAGADLPTKEFWGKTQYLGIVTAPLMWLIFGYNHSNRDKQIPHRAVFLLAIVPLITLVLALTNGTQGAIWQEVYVDTFGDFSTLGGVRGPWFWVLAAYSYLLLLSGSIFIVRSIGRLPGAYRGQTPALLVVVLAPWVANILYLAHLSPIPNLDLTPFVFALSMVALVWGILGFQLIDLLPVARDVVVEEMNDGMIVLDARGRIVDINPAAQHMIGLTVSQAIGRRAAEVLSAGLHPAERFSDAMEAQEEITIGDGEAQRWYELRLSPLKDRRQRVTGRVVTYRDITKRIQTEKALRANEERFRWLFATLPDAVLLIDPHDSAAWPIVDCNEAAGQMNGYSRAELIGQSIDIFNLTPGTREEHGAYLDRLRREGTVHAEALHRHKDGHVFPVEVSTSLFTFAGQDLVLGIDRDITERKHVEEELRRSKEELETRVAERTAELRNANEQLQVQLAERIKAEQARSQLAAIVESSDDAIIGETLDGIIVSWNQGAEKVYGYPADEVVGRPVSILIPPDLSAELPPILDRLRRGESINHYETARLRKDGQRIDVSLTISPMSDSDGNLSGASTIARDITQRKQAEETLRESEQIFRGFLEQSEDAVMLTNNQGMLVQWSRGAEKLTGFSREESLGKPLWDIQFRSAPDAFKSPQSYERIKAALQTMLLTGKGALLNNLVEAEIQRPDGARLTTQTLAFLVHTDKGFLLGNILRDITERKRMEVQLRERVATLQALAEIDREMIAATEPQKVLDLVCRCAAELVHTPKSAIVVRTASEIHMTASYGMREAARVGAELVRAQQAGLLNLDVLKPREALALNEITPDILFLSEAIGAEGVRALAIVPFAVGGELAGVLMTLDTVTRQWQTDDLQILALLAGQAALALEKLRLFGMARSRALHLATLNEIGQAITSSLDLDRVLLTLLDKVREATAAEACSVALVEQSPSFGGIDRESGDLVFRQAVGGDVDAVIGLRLSPGQGLAGWVAQHRQSVLVPDAASDSRSYTLRDEGKFITRDLIGVPLIAHDVVIGVIELVNKHNGIFDEEDVQLLASVATQAAIAIENARLFEETRRRLDEMSVVSNVALVGAAGRSFDETVLRATEALNWLWPDASLGYMFMDEANQSLLLHPSYHGFAPEEASTRLRVALGQDLIGWAVRERQPIYVGDVQSDPRYVVEDPSVHSEMVAPLVVGERVIGVVNVASPQLHAFSGDDLHLLTTLAGQLATIFEKARLDAELAKHAALLEQRVIERTRELSIANEQLQELDHLKDQFVSNVSHELRTPLANLKLYLSLLERGRPEKRAEYMQTLRREQQRLDKMIEDLLDLSRLDLGVTSIQPVPTDLNLLLSQLIADRAALAAEHQLLLDYQPADALPLALIDPVMLTEVITNLVGNAINYTPAGGMVTVGTAAREDAGRACVTFTVQDNGLGISARDLPHLFERFYRGEVGRKASAPGTGLGLAISKEIVEKMGGRITIESEPSHGAAFMVWLRPAE